MWVIDPHLDYGYEESSVVQKSTLTYYKIGEASKRIEVVKAKDSKKIKSQHFGKILAFILDCKIK